MERYASLERVITPFRAPEVHQAILEFDRELYFYHDQKWDIGFRFEVIDEFARVFRDWSGRTFENFRFYPVNGSTEAIAWCLYDLKNRGLGLALVEGEYRFYAYVAEKLGIPLRTVRGTEDIDPSFVFVTSKPFCQTGTVAPAQLKLLHECERRNVEVWLDCAYFGSTAPIDWHMPGSTSNLFFSFSKQYGLALERIGVWLRREPLPDREAMGAAGYFPIGKLALVTELMKRFPADWLHRTYARTQARICRELGEQPSGIAYMTLSGRCLTDRMTL